MYTVPRQQSKSLSASPIQASSCRGFSLLMVMLAVSLCLVLTFTFLRSQATVLKIDENAEHRDQALAAARAGMSMAMKEMNSSEWQGVDSELSRVVESNPIGAASYHVTWERSTPAAGSSANAPVSALEVVVRSIGTWQSSLVPDRKIARTVEALARINPRLPGRAPGPADSASASDRAENPGDYDAMQEYALVATGGSNSLIINPGDRIEGDMWLRENLLAYRGPSWASGVRNQYLTDVGTKFVQGTTDRIRKHPHPLAGRVDFYLSSPPSSLVDDLNRLKVDYRSAMPPLTMPVIDWSAWQTYRVYEKGFSYAAETLPYLISNVTLRPTAENPLGIFYRDSSIQLGDDVTIQGTLVVRGDVQILGRRVHLAAFNWRGDVGASLVEGRSLWQKLPAIVARNVEIERESASVVEGAVITEDGLTGAGGTLEYAPVNDVDIVGTATATPLRQPLSLVTLEGQPSLGAIDGSGNYAVWLDAANGVSGQWYRIVGVDSGAWTLTVVGEAERTSAVASRIRPVKLRYADIRGPLAGTDHRINHQVTWTLTDSLWDSLYTTWQTENSLLEVLGLPTILFIDWLADPTNLLDLGYPLSSTGMVLEPTFHLSHHRETSYRWQPPLFRPFVGEPDDEPHEGYRWRVIEWREAP